MGTDWPLLLCFCRQGARQTKLRVTQEARDIVAAVLSKERTLLDQGGAAIEFQTKLTRFQKAALVALVNHELAVAHRTVDQIQNTRTRSARPPTRSRGAPLSSRLRQPEPTRRASSYPAPWNLRRGL